jgi:hypothetical protein
MSSWDRGLSKIMASFIKKREAPRTSIPALSWRGFRAAGGSLRPRGSPAQPPGCNNSVTKR